MLPSLVLRRRYAARYRQITTTLVAHGFGGLVAPIGISLRGRLPRRRMPAVDGATPPQGVGATRPMHLRLALEELGPVFIKLGQILSTRADLLPPEYIAELIKLQDHVPPAPFAAIEQVIETELGQPIAAAFAEIDPTALATASIGQVHAARLRDGSDVVVKVQRPGVDRLVAEDLAILTDLAGVATRRMRLARQLGAAGLVSEFAWTLHGELDYLREGRNAERMARMFANDPRVHIPRIVWSHTTGRVLTMERLRGVRIDDLGGIAAGGFERRDVAERAVMLFLREVFEEGFFHADPHPGNFVVMADGSIGAMDFGMVGAINDHRREQLLLLLIAIVERDTRRITDDLIALGATGPDLDRTALERDIDHLLAQYYGRTLAEIRVSRVIGEAMALVRRNRLHLPSELALLAKTIVQGEALGRHLEPSFEVTKVAEPYVKQAMRMFYSPSYWRGKLRLRTLEAMMLASALPGQAQRILTRLERNELTFHIHYDELPETLSSLNGMVNRLALAILTAAMGIGLAMVFQATGPELRSWVGALFVFGFAAVAALATGLLIAIWRRGR